LLDGFSANLVAPAVAAAASVLVFDEWITLAIAIGIAAVVLGVWFIGRSRYVTRPALLWAIATGLCIAVYTVIDAQGVRRAPSAASYIVWLFLTMGGGIGVLSIVTYGLALAAFRLGATPRLAALRETSILFATLIAVVFLKERLSRERMLGVACIAIGAAVLIGAG
jgi:uncharacterized membrane protein